MFYIITILSLTITIGSQKQIIINVALLSTTNVTRILKYLTITNFKYYRKNNEIF